MQPCLRWRTRGANLRPGWHVHNAATRQYGSGVPSIHRRCTIERGRLGQGGRNAGQRRPVDRHPQQTQAIVRPIDLQSHRGDACAPHLEGARRCRRHIDNPVVRVWSAVSDLHHHGPPGRQVCHPHHCAEWQEAMCGRQCLRVQTPPICHPDLAPMGRVPRRYTVLHARLWGCCLDRRLRRRRYGRGRAGAKCQQRQPARERHTHDHLWSGKNGQIRAAPALVRSGMRVIVAASQPAGIHPLVVPPSAQSAKSEDAP